MSEMSRSPSLRLADGGEKEPTWLATIFHQSADKYRQEIDSTPSAVVEL